MLNSTHYITSSNPEDFYGNHAEGYYRKLLVNLNEAEGKKRGEKAPAKKKPKAKKAVAKKKPMADKKKPMADKKKPMAEKKPRRIMVGNEPILLVPRK